MHFLIFHVFHCFTFSIATRLPNYLHNSLSTVSHSYSLSHSLFFSFHCSLYFTLPTFSHYHSLSHSLFFFSYHRSKTMSWCCCSPNARQKWGKCRTKNSGYASFSLSMCFFSIFFTACSLFLLKLPFFFLPSFKDDGLVPLFSKCRTEMTEIPNEKLKGYASFSLSMCFFFRFFSQHVHCFF